MRGPGANTWHPLPGESIALEMRATSRRICDDCVQRVDVKRVNLPAGEKLSRLNFSIVGMQRTAAILRAWRVTSHWLARRASTVSRLTSERTMSCTHPVSMATR